MNKRDLIDVEIRKYKLKKHKLPSYLIINQNDYFLLKEEVGYSFDKDIILFAGCSLLITMDLEEPIRVI